MKTILFIILCLSYMWFILPPDGAMSECEETHSTDVCYQILNR
jgi:hypothetical protein